MGLTFRDPKCIAASAQVTDDVTNPFNLHSVWTVQRISDGAILSTHVDTPLPTTDPLIQADWDTIYATVTTYFGTATGGTTAATNPVVL